MYAETVICKLYEARTDLGLTQQQVADGADMNVRTLINIEKGRSIPSLLYAMNTRVQITDQITHSAETTSTGSFDIAGNLYLFSLGIFQFKTFSLSKLSK